MTLESLIRKHGNVYALKAINQHRLAEKLKLSLEYQRQVVDDEGIMPFEERPLETRLKLIESNLIERNATEFLYDNRLMNI